MNSMISSPGQLIETVELLGFLPFFHNHIPGFSIQEMVEPRLWFSDTEPGPWDWKDEVIASGRVAYGKFFRGKAGYVSLEMLPDFLNYRRATYSISRIVPDNAGFSEYDVLQIIDVNEHLLSRDLKQMLGIGKRRKRRAGDLVDLSGVEALSAGVSRAVIDKMLANLQMAGRVVISGFEYARNRKGETYGWGLARYSTPESLFGSAICTAASDSGRSPAASLELILTRLSRSLPAANSRKLRQLLK